MQREFMEYDIVIVGAGPSGLAAAIRLKQLNDDYSVCVVEKGSEIGAHILSGAVFEPRALNELFPNWAELNAPLHTPVVEDDIYVLKDERSALKVPALLVPKTLHNEGNYIISLGNLCRWLGQQAESLGVEIYPGFSGAQPLFNDQGAVSGIITGDLGISSSGEHKDSFTPGIELRAKYTLLAEGSRGHLGKQLTQHFQLDQDAEAQHYAIGIKELWEIPQAAHRPGLVVHTAGWPLNEHNALGGSFLYHLDNCQVSLGLITDLGYDNPHLSPFDEFQRYKHHPLIKQHLQDGQRIAYGARAITKGGIQALPKMEFPGGLLIGCNAGTLNFAKIKGSHTAMKSGMVAAEVVHQALSQSQNAYNECLPYTQAFKQSWAYQELYQQRNFGPAQHKFGNILGSAYAFIDLNLFNGKLPWTLSDPVADHSQLKPAEESIQIHYPKPDGLLSFDKLSSVFLSNTHHEENQPCHLQLKNPDIPLQQNLPLFDEPAQRYCPAGVYEVVKDQEGKRFQINAQNCVHCKTCDIKDPSQNITWVVPEGAGGPNYPNM